MNQNTKTSYKRIGRCQPSKCGGICCKLGMGLIVTRGKNPRYVGTYYEDFGFRVVKLKEFTAIFPRLQCRHQDLNNKCTKHKRRPQICKDFPQTPDHDFYKVCKKYGCTYNFVKVKK